MRRADCAPLAGRRANTAQIASWEGIMAPPAAAEPEEPAGTTRDFYRRLLAYGIQHCLTRPQREAVELCMVQGLTATQAARQLGLHPSAMSRRLRRAMARLRQLAPS